MVFLYLLVADAVVAENKVVMVIITINNKFFFITVAFALSAGYGQYSRVNNSFQMHHDALVLPVTAISSVRVFCYPVFRKNLFWGKRGSGEEPVLYGKIDGILTIV